MILQFLEQLPVRIILSWVLPPLLGAVIGYVTNAIAIRMLFRPLEEVRVFGVRLPLTPGIIPKQRFQLAESIGEMVSRELLTEEAVRRQLATEGFRGRLEANIDSLLGDLIGTPLERLQRGNQELVLASVQGFLSEALYAFFSSRSFIHGVRGILGRLVRSLGERPVGELLGSREWGTLIVERMTPLLAQPDSKAKIADALERWLELRRSGDQPLASIVSEELIATITELLATLFPSGLDSLFRWLDQEDTREQMNHRGKKLLRNVLEKLNVLQRFLLSAGQFDRTLEQKMPEVVEEAVAALREYAYEASTLESFKDVLQRSLTRWSRRPAGELFAHLRPGFAGELVQRLLQRLGEEPLRVRLAGGIDRVVQRLKRFTAGEILTRYLRIPEQEAVDAISNKVLAFLARRETSQAIAAEVVAFSRKFIEEHRRDSIAELLHIEPDLQKRAAGYLNGRLIGIIDARLPAFIESFDVRQLVVEKINDLDVEQVERLLLMVIQKHLRWINVFGGILGALIGFSQLLLRLLN